MIWDILRVAGALFFAVVIYLIGAFFVRSFAQGEPPPEPGEVPLEDVDYRFKCIVCGAQAVLYSAPEGEVPDAPRHCREQMVLDVPIGE